MSEGYSEPFQTSKMERSAKIIKGFQPLTMLAKTSILDVWLVSECIFAYISFFNRNARKQGTEKLYVITSFGRHSTDQSAFILTSFLGVLFTSYLTSCFTSTYLLVWFPVCYVYFLGWSLALYSYQDYKRVRYQDHMRDEIQVIKKCLSWGCYRKQKIDLHGEQKHVYIQQYIYNIILSLLKDKNYNQCLITDIFVLISLWTLEK